MVRKRNGKSEKTEKQKFKTADKISYFGQRRHQSHILWFFNDNDTIYGIFLFLQILFSEHFFRFWCQFRCQKRCHFSSLYTAKDILYLSGYAFKVFRRSIRIYILRNFQRCVSEQILFELRLYVSFFQSRRIGMPQNMESNI